MRFDDHFLSWVLIYAILVYIADFLLNILNINNYFLILLFAGFIISLGSWIFYSILYKNNFRLNGWFIVWIFTNSLSYWLIGLLLGFFTISAQFLYYLFFGFVFHLLTWLIKHKIYGKLRIKNKNSKLILMFFGLIIILFLVSSASINQNDYNNQSFSDSTSLISKLKSLFGSSNDCPQIEVPLLERQDKSFFSYYITDISNIGSNAIFPNLESAQNAFLNKVGGNVEDVQKGWEIRVYSSNEFFGVRESMIACHQGNSEGENPKYFYCDTGANFWSGGIPYLSKTMTNSDGIIGKTIRKSFINIYDENRKFIKTVCGSPPEEIAEAEFKQTMRELDEFFSLK